MSVPGSATEQQLDAAEIGSSVYETAEFIMYAQRFSHDWTTCPFAHPGEKAKRRDIRTHNYDCEMCPAVVKGEVCELGAACPHSHHVFESWLHPQKFRTMLCKDDKCQREVCFFAHGAEQLRVPTRDCLPHMPLAGPSRLRKQSSLPSEQQQQAGGGSSSSNACGLLASHPFSNAAAPGQERERLHGQAWQFTQQPRQPSRHLFQQQQYHQQQQGGMAAVLSGADALAASPNSSPSAGLGFGYTLHAAAAAAAAAAAGATGGAANCSQRWPMQLPVLAQQQQGAGGSESCESSTSSMMVMPVGQTMPLRGDWQGSPAAAQQLPAAQTAAAASASGYNQPQADSSVLSGSQNVSDLRALLSSLVQQVQTSKQEASESRNAAAEAQQQLKALTDALRQGFSTPGPAGSPADQAAALATAEHLAALSGEFATAAASLQQAEMAAAAAGLPCSTGSLLQPVLAVLQSMSPMDQLSLVQHLQAASATQDPASQVPISHTLSSSSSSNRSCSGAWVLGPPGQLVRGTSDIRAGSMAAPAADGCSSCLQQAGPSNWYAVLPHANNPQADNSSANSSSYGIAAGNARAKPGVMDWLQLLPALAGFDGNSMMPMLPAAGSAGAGGMSSSPQELPESFQVPQPPAWLSGPSSGPLQGQLLGNPSLSTAGPCNYSDDRGSRCAQSNMSAAGAGYQPGSLPETAARAAAPRGFGSSNSLQQLAGSRQQQLPSGYLRQLQQTHGLIGVPDLMLLNAQAGSGMQDERQQVHSAAAILQGWGGGPCALDEPTAIRGSGTLEGMLSPSGDGPMYNAGGGGATNLGWL